MKYHSVLPSIAMASVITIGALSSCDVNLNPVYDEHFDSEGHLLPEYKDSVAFEPLMPGNIKFYVEVSGSMNGFFRANKPTQFKADVWNILSYYSALTPEVVVLTNDGNQGASYKQDDFKQLMNTGKFVSTASTKVPLMLQNIIDNLNADAGEVAVLISDMKYSPVGDSAPDVLMTQYSTDIGKTLGNYGKAVCLLGATSDYVDKTGNVLCQRSPYYYLVIGAPQQVAAIRNGISTLLDNEHHFVDNIESGFDYGRARYDFGFPVVRCEQLVGEPTFYNYESPENEDTCTIMLKLQLENYRWIVADKDMLSRCFLAKTIHGSELKTRIDTVVVQNISDRELTRTATATIELKLYDMQLDADVIEWTIKLPDTDRSLFDKFLIDADDENDVTKSYSVSDFIKGMFYDSVVNRELKPNYILVTKNS